MTLAIEIDHVSYSFRNGFFLKPKWILDDIHFNVAEGSVYGLLGPNGAGKTSLIHLIIGLSQPKLGELKVFGFPSCTRAAKTHIGFLPERPYFPAYLTGEEVLKYFGALSGMKTSQIKSRILPVLGMVDMKEARKIALRHYSKGMLQRIGIAQALLHDPSLLILDEPMSGLDPLGRKEMRELILQLSQAGRTIFFSSHIISDVEAICHRLVMLKNGRLLANAPIEQLLAEGLKGSKGGLAKKGLQTEIVLSGLSKIKDSEWPEFQSIQQMQELWRVMVSGKEDVNAVLGKLLKNSATILSVIPQRPSLEDLFTKENPKSER